jgi:hypothetical protein
MYEILARRYDLYERFRDRADAIEREVAGLLTTQLPRTVGNVV